MIKRTFSKELIEKVSILLSQGFNCSEIAIQLQIHPVNIRFIKLQLKEKAKQNDKTINI